MRKIIQYGLFATAMAVSFSGQAGSGTAIVSHWGAAASTTSTPKPTYMFPSNITDHFVDVSITFYGSDGSVMAPSELFNFTNSNTQMAPKTSGDVSMQSNAFNYGYTTISWKNAGDTNDTVAFVTQAFRKSVHSTSSNNDFSIENNDGQPF